MTDKELLELAAKAAGIDLSKWKWFEAPTPRFQNMLDGYPTMTQWNPLTDDGDALRLAVKVLNWPNGGRAFDNTVSAMFSVGQLPKDPYAATRRAIVRAAAEIGKGME